MSLVKFMKIEFKNREWDGHHIDIQVKGDAFQDKIKVPRKVRNCVANFFGEPIELIHFDSSMFIQITDTTDRSNIINLENIFLKDYYERFEPTGKCSLVFQNQRLKVYWMLKTIQHTLSRKSSDLSRDLQNIDTPKCRNIFKQDDQRHRIFSPMPQRRKATHDSALEDLCEIQSQPQQGQSSSPEYMLLPPRKSKNGIKVSQIVLNQIKYKASEKTRSKTQEKNKKVEKKHSILKCQQTKGQNIIRSHIASLGEENRKNIVKKRGSIKSPMINKTGAALVSTFGVIFGIFGGIVCQKGF